MIISYHDSFSVTLFFHLALQELTLADKFMVGVYSFIFVSFMVSIVLLKLQREKLYTVAEIFYLYAEGVVSINPTISWKHHSSYQFLHWYGIKTKFQLGNCFEFRKVFFLRSHFGSAGATVAS